MDIQFARVRALPDGRATAPFAKMAIAALILIGFAQFAGSQIPRTYTQPKPFVTSPTSTNKPSKRDASKSGAKKSGAIPGPNLAKEPTLYVVGYAHLDTEWRWEYPQVIEEYLTKTMRNNFALFEKYPHYIFNFTGANRYRLMKEYYPSDFERLKQYVAKGRWFPAGSSMEEGDVNSPNAESIVRQILYGNNWFRKEFGMASDEYMLPDCFGFPASLPSILAHSGIKGFSTQKLSSGWQPAPHVGGPDSPEKTPSGIPFNVGIWEGPDGKTIIAALNPLGYGSQVTYDLSKTPPPPPGPDPSLTAQQNQTRSRGQEDWAERIQTNGDLTGVFADYHYVGTGDVGGSPNESSVRLMEAITSKSKTTLPPMFQFGPPSTTPSGPLVQVGDGPVKVVWSKADQMFQDIANCCATDRMPRYKGDLELINHSAGSLTSEAYQKRWMRKNELLADAAEKASVAADWLDGRPYPLERLNNAWTLVMGGQFHDLLPGTATPKAFEFAWNDDVIALNQFAGVLTSAASAVSSMLETNTKGNAIVVYNPLNIQREDIVEATVTFPGNAAPNAVRVFGPDGKEAPAQLSNGKVLFLAKVPSVGFAVYNVEPADAGNSSSDLKTTESSLENNRYRIVIDKHGDVSSIFDKQISRELLSAPIRLAISTDNPRQWPAWNMDFEDEQKPPRAYVGGAIKTRVVENGPVRVAIEVERETEDSKFVQTISLSTGDAGNRVEFRNVIDWKTKQANLKATFPLAATNKLATYNWDIGTVQRPNAEERQFEVASHQWIDLTDQSGAYGATILTDCKNGSDKPDDKTVRLTLVRTPGTRGGYADQGTQDLGRHEIVFGLAGHGNGWREAGTDWQAYRLNQPLIAFESSKHPGALGKSFSLLKINNDRVRVLALKKAELTNEVIVRVVEMDGKPAENVRFNFPAAVVAAREVNGQEQPIGPAKIESGALVTSLGAYQPRTFALKIAAPNMKAPLTQSQPVTLDYELSVASRRNRPADGCFDWAPNNQGAPQGKALPAEMLPREISLAGIRFKLAPADIGKANAVVAHGQTITLPPGKYNRVYLLAAAVNGDQKATFRAGEKSFDLTIQDWTGFIGQWDDRIWKVTEEQIAQRPGAPAPPAGALPPRTRTNVYGEMLGLRPGFIKRADVAWFASHRNAADGSAEAYAYSYLFAYVINLPAGARTLVLPDNDRIRILAITVADEPATIRPAQPLYDTLERN
ncbi:MAG TPA: glycoside hydrolase family 38 C-terminal domain-containing protein [Pyrinomonadaceae bacterium]|nr:glycoside hydrolase family 38 C-terminal domain-containing protein [Pyrinomonadaceae bacterium]